MIATGPPAFGQQTHAKLLTLFYLANQIRQANEIARFSTFKDIMSLYGDVNKLLTTDATLRQALMKSSPPTPDEEEQIYNFATLFCNVWQSAQAAHDNKLIDETDFASAVRDARVEINRWPNFRSAVERWMATYPEACETEIFRALKLDDQRTASSASQTR